MINPDFIAFDFYYLWSDKILATANNEFCQPNYYFLIIYLNKGKNYTNSKVYFLSPFDSNAIRYKLYYSIIVLWFYTNSFNIGIILA